MNMLKKVSLLSGGILLVTTIGVAAKNAIDINIEEKKRKQSLYEKYVKRPMDFFCAGLAMVILSPVMAVTALIVRINLGSPVLFTQDRPGRDGKVFKLYKFRSMSDKRDDEGNLLPDKMRLNRFGKVLRSTSLDELPELFNIIKGDMSIVGPRPLLVSYLDNYNSHDMRRHEVRPGLTGLAQVSGRAALSWKEKFEKDVEYVDNISFCMDTSIIFTTIKKVFAREDIEFKTGNQPIAEYFAQQTKKF